MKPKTKDNVKRYIISTLVTFLAGAGTVLYAQIDNIDVSTLQNGAYVGVAFAVIRGGVKAVLEFGLSTHRNPNE